MATSATSSQPNPRPEWQTILISAMPDKKEAESLADDIQKQLKDMNEEKDDLALFKKSRKLFPLFEVVIEKLDVSTQQKMQPLLMKEFPASCSARIADMEKKLNDFFAEEQEYLKTRYSELLKDMVTFQWGRATAGKVFSKMKTFRLY